MANIVIVNKDKKCFSATLGEKKIIMTFEELSLIEKLLDAVTNDYVGDKCIAYMDENGKIIKIGRK